MKPTRLSPVFPTAISITAVALTSAAPQASAAESAAEPAITRTAADPELDWGGCPDFLPAGCAIAVLHGDPSRPNVDILFKVPGGSRIAPHTHTSAERMVLIAGEMEVTYDGQDTATLKPGTYAYGPAKHPHHAACVSEDPCILFIAFEDPLDAMPIPDAGR